MRGAALNVATCLFVGILIGSAWIVFADGVLYANRDPAIPSFQFLYALPAMLVTFSMLLLNFTSPREMRGGGNRSLSMSGDDEGPRMAMCARIWVVIMISLGFAALGGAVWVAVSVYTPAEASTASAGSDGWPGGAQIANVCLILFAGLLYFMRPH